MAGTALACTVKSAAPGLAMIATALTVVQALREYGPRRNIGNLRVNLVNQIPSLVMAGMAVWGMGLLLAFGGGLMALAILAVAQGKESLSGDDMLNLATQACLVGFAPSLVLAMSTARCAALFWRLLTHRTESQPTASVS